MKNDGFGTDMNKRRKVGTGAGAVAGAVTGGAMGSVIPGVGTTVGAAVGGAVGAVTGAAAGNQIAQRVNFDAEEQHWRETYTSRPYVEDATYEDLAPAYQYGFQTRVLYLAPKTFDDVEPELERHWEAVKGDSPLGWERAKHAARDAWERIERGLPDVFKREKK